MNNMFEIKNDTIKKTFDYKGEDNFTFLKNEVFWLNYLKSKWVPELLEVGNPWEVIEQLTTEEVSLVMGILMAKQERQQEEQARQMSQQNSFKKMGGF